MLCCELPVKNIPAHLPHSLGKKRLPYYAAVICRKLLYKNCFAVLIITIRPTDRPLLSNTAASENMPIHILRLTIVLFHLPVFPAHQVVFP